MLAQHEAGLRARCRVRQRHGTARTGSVGDGTAEVVNIKHEIFDMNATTCRAFFEAFG